MGTSRKKIHKKPAMAIHKKPAMSKAKGKQHKPAEEETKKELPTQIFVKQWQKTYEGKYYVWELESIAVKPGLSCKSKFVGFACEVCVCCLGIANMNVGVCLWTSILPHEYMWGRSIC